MWVGVCRQEENKQQRGGRARNHLHIYVGRQVYTLATARRGEDARDAIFNIQYYCIPARLQDGMVHMDCMGLLSSVNTPYAAVTASILFYNIMAHACFRISLTCNSSVST